MNYDEAKIIYNNSFSLAAIPVKAKVKLELINLICFLAIRANIRPYNLLTKKVYPKNDGPIHEIIAISCICDDLLKTIGEDDFSNYGYTNAKEILLRIKEILDDTLPF